MKYVLGLCFLLALGACSDGTGRSSASSNTEACTRLNYDGNAYTVCKFKSSADIRLFHSDPDGEPYRQFDVLSRELAEQSQTLIFAMNGGMYHEDRSPVGYYRDSFGDRARINLNDGPGNFHLKPNGVFWLKGDTAGIVESAAYVEAKIEPDYATQSGPMLVINGAIHPQLNPDGSSHKRRNGVGVSADASHIYFAISDTAVTFHDFASLFRDHLETPNALFLDGQVSRLYAPGIDRNEAGADLGPIVGVVE